MALGFGREVTPAGLAGVKTVVSVRGVTSGTNTRLCSGGGIKSLQRESVKPDPEKNGFFTKYFSGRFDHLVWTG